MIVSSCVNITSHKPSYPRHYLTALEMSQTENEQVLALFSYFENYQFNFQFSSKCQLYAKFKRQYELFKAANQKALPAPPPESKKKKKRSSGKKNVAGEEPKKQSTPQKQPPKVPMPSTSTIVSTIASTAPKFNFMDALEKLQNDKLNLKASQGFETDFISFDDDAPLKKITEVSTFIQITSTNRSIAMPSTSQQTEIVAHSHDDSNSNYSFSEFYKEQEAKEKANAALFKEPANVENSHNKTPIESVTITDESLNESNENLPDDAESLPNLVKNPFASNAVQPLPDFIPLSNENIKPVQIQQTQEVRGNARVMLSKEHCSILMLPKSRDFLNDLTVRLNMVMEFKWDNTGNSLQITGLPSDQTMFHAEIREYLFNFEMIKCEKAMETSSQLPKNKARIIGFIKTNLKSASKQNLFSARRQMQILLDAERSFNFKKVLKCRKSLNIIFMGHGELGDGGSHLGALRKILFELEKELRNGDIRITNELRLEISNHMKYIFSTMNHGDYKDLLKQYTNALRNRQKKPNLVPNPICLK